MEFLRFQNINSIQKYNLIDLIDHASQEHPVLNGNKSFRSVTHFEASVAHCLKGIENSPTIQW